MTDTPSTRFGPTGVDPASSAIDAPTAKKSTRLHQQLFRIDHPTFLRLRTLAALRTDSELPHTANAICNEALTEYLDRCPELQQTKKRA